jgi:hypothetical protein
VPITYTIDQERRLILTKVNGNLNIARTIEYFDRLQQDSDCPDEAIELVDFTEVTDFSIQYGDMRVATKKYQEIKATRHILATVFNCPSTLSYGIGRMLQALHEIANEKHLVAIARSEQEMANYVENFRSNKPNEGDKT